MISMKHVLASTLALLAASPAISGGIATPVAAPAEAPVAAAAEPAGSQWDGPYIGFQFGTFDGTYSFPGRNDLDVDGTGIGAFIGYRSSLGGVVLGGEVDYLTGQIAFPDSLAVGSGFDADIDRLVRIGAQAGVDLGGFLVYGTAGYASISVTDEFGNGFGSGDGRFAGVGFDLLATNHVVVGAELLHHWFEDLGDTPAAGLDLRATTIGLNVAYRF
jgi:hypothetical protein